MAEVVQTMDKLGFETYDILGTHYFPVSKTLIQLDILFLKKDSKWIPKENLE